MGSTTPESEFAVFSSISDIVTATPLFHLRVTSVESTSCVAVLRDELAEGQQVQKLPPEAVALQVKNGRPIGNLRVRVAADFVHRNVVLEAIERTEAANGVQRWGVSISADEQAELGIVSGDEQGILAFEVLDKQILGLGLNRLAFTITAQVDRLETVLRAAAHFFHHLRRTPEKGHGLRSKVAMHVHQLKESDKINDDLQYVLQPDKYDIIQPILDDKDPPVWKVLADGGATHYGVELENKINNGFYACLLYFDCSTLEIREYPPSYTTSKRR
jgi:hypothetical protein